jgi:hypothetical protein
MNNDIIELRRLVNVSNRRALDVSPSVTVHQARKYTSFLSTRFQGCINPSACDDGHDGHVGVARIASPHGW